MASDRSGADLEIPTAGEALRGYVSVPPGGRGPGVVVLHENSGLVDHIRDVCDRLGREGFVALAPDLYHGRTAATREEARSLSADLDETRLATDLEGSVAALLNHHAVDGARVGVVGFCMGGHLALFAATRSSRVGVVVDFYGAPRRVEADLSRLEAAVLAVFGENDEVVPAESVDALRSRFEAAGKKAVFVIQPGVGHAFMNDSRPDRYDAAAAAENWHRMLSFLRAELA